MLPVAFALLFASLPSGHSVIGTWINPDRSVAVRTRPCGPGVCGRVVWASAKAQADARKGGVSRLVGTELLRNYAPVSDGAWEGQVFVPDRGRTFESHMIQLNAQALQIDGCVAGGLLCKKQVWRRVAARGRAFG